MIEIIKGTTPLDLEPGTNIERERTSPFFSIDEIPGEISFPFKLKNSDKNMKELGYVDYLPSTKVNRHPVLIKDDGLQVTAAQLVTEYVQSNLDRSNVGMISAYTLSGSSEFWQRIKGKKLKDLNLGGDRSFPWAGFSTSGGGFWGHVHNTWNYTSADDGDYTFYPIHNAGYKGHSKGWMNMLGQYGSSVEMARDENVVTLCPCIFLVYVIKQLFATFGYTVKGDILNDADFKSLTFPSFYGIHWTNYRYYEVGGYTYYHLDNVTFNLRDHVPQEWDVSTFLIELQKFLPLGFDILDNKRECEIVLLGEIKPAGATDRSSEIYADVQVKLEKEEKVFKFSRIFENDAHASKVDLTRVKYLGEINTEFDFPPVGNSKLGDCYLVRNYNLYYFLTQDGNGNIFWDRYGDNIYDYEEGDNTNETISSRLCPIPMSLNVMFVGGSYTVDTFWPDVYQEGNWFGKKEETKHWGIRLLFYRGKMSFKGIIDLPQATAHNYNTNLVTPVKVGDWTLSYKIGNDGLYDRFWKKWLDVLRGIEVLVADWRPSLVDYLSFRWRNVLLVNNTPYLITKIKETLPYKNRVSVEAKRIK